MVDGGWRMGDRGWDMGNEGWALEDGARWMNQVAPTKWSVQSLK